MDRGHGGSSGGNAAPQYSTERLLKEVMHKITQIIVRARIPAHAELEKSSPLNRWFNFQLPEWAGVRGNLDILLRSPSSNPADDTPPPAVGSASGTASQLLSPLSAGSSSSGMLPHSSSGSGAATSSSSSSKDSAVTSSIIQLDILMRSTKNPSQYVLLERWNFQHERIGGHHSTSGGATDMGASLGPPPMAAPASSSSASSLSASRRTDQATMYKKLVLLVRSLYSFVKILPAYDSWRMAQLCLERREDCPFALVHQLSSSERSLQQLQAAGLTPPSAHGPLILTPSFDQSPRCYSFTPIPTPVGKLALSVFYRAELSAVDFLNAGGIANISKLVGRMALSETTLGFNRGGSGGGGMNAGGGGIGAGSPLSHGGNATNLSNSLGEGQTATMHVSGAGQQIIMEDYMAAPDSSKHTQAAHMMATMSKVQADAQQQQQQQQYRHQHEEPSSAQGSVSAPPPKSGLSWGLEQERMRREAMDGHMPTQQQARERSKTLPSHPNFVPIVSDGSRAASPTAFANSAMTGAGAPSSRTERSHSVFDQHPHAPTQHQPRQPSSSSRDHAQRTSPSPTSFDSHGRPRADSDNSDLASAMMSNSVSTSSASSSRPMSIPRHSPHPISAGSMPNQSSYMQAQIQAQQQQHEMLRQQQQQQQQQRIPSSHSPSSDPPSFNQSSTPPHHPHSYSHSRSFSPTTHLTSTGASLPYNHSGSNLEQLNEEDDQQRLYDGSASATSSSSSTSATPHHARLPHSQSQPVHLSPALRPGSASGSLPVPIPTTSGVTSAVHSRRNSLSVGTPPDNSGLPTGSPPSTSLGRGKPPLPASAYTPITASSRVTTSTSTFSPQLHPTSPNTAAGSSSSSSGITVREREPGQSRFSVSHATLNYPPPIISSANTSPNQSPPSGLGQALARHQQQHATLGTSAPTTSSPRSSGNANVYPPPQMSGSGHMHTRSAGSPHQSRMLTSATTGGSPQGGGSPNPFQSSRPISIPSSSVPKSSHLPSTTHTTTSSSPSVGSLFGHTPPFGSSATALGLMQSSSGSGGGKQSNTSAAFTPSPTAFVPIMHDSTSSSTMNAAAAVAPSSLKNSNSWQQSQPPIPLTVAPFKTGRKSISSAAGSPALQPQSSPLTRVQIAPSTIPTLDLDNANATAHATKTSAAVMNGIISGNTSAEDESTATASMFAFEPAPGPAFDTSTPTGGVASAFGGGELVGLGFDQDVGGDDGGDGDAALGKFTSFLRSLQESSSRGSVSGSLFAPPPRHGSDGSGGGSGGEGGTVGTAPSASISISSSPMPSSSQSSSQLHQHQQQSQLLTAPHSMRTHTVQSLFDQMDQLTQAMR